MADKKITALTELTATGKDSSADLLHIIDFSASPVNKKITVASLFNNANTDTHIYGASKTLEVGFAAATNAHLTVTTGANASTDGAVTINQDGEDFVDFLVKTGESDSALSIDSGADTVTINGDSANLDFIVNGDAVAKMLFVDASSDVVGVGVAAPDTAYTLDVAATGTNAIKAAGTVAITGSITASTTAAFNGSTTVGVAGAGVLFLPSVESVTYASGTTNHPSVAVTTSIVTLTTGASSGALPNGTAVGQIKILSCIARSGGAVYTNTPTTMNGFASFAMNAIGDAIMLQWQTAGWTVLSFGSCVLA